MMDLEEWSREVRQLSLNAEKDYQDMLREVAYLEGELKKSKDIKYKESIKKLLTEWEETLAETRNRLDDLHIKITDMLRKQGVDVYERE